MSRKRSTGLPSRKQILDFIASSDQPAGKREIARAFGLSGQTKIDLKRLLKDMADEGLIDSSPGRAFHQSGGVPGAASYKIRWRRTDTNNWQNARASRCASACKIVLPHIRVDDWVFGVSSVSKAGFESPVASAIPGGAFKPYIAPEKK